MIPGITASTRRKVEAGIPRQVIMEWDGYYSGFRRNHTGGQWRRDTVQLESLQPLWFSDRYDRDSEEMLAVYPSLSHNSTFSGVDAGQRSLTFYINYVNFRWVFEEAWVIINGEYFNLLEGVVTETESYGQFTYSFELDPVDPSPILPDQDNLISGRIVMNPIPDE